MAIYSKDLFRFFIKFFINFIFFELSDLNLDNMFLIALNNCELMFLISHPEPDFGNTSDLAYNETSERVIVSHVRNINAKLLLKISDGNVSRYNRYTSWPDRI